MIAFGPVPSRRLGFSLGINHIPQKHCPYACVYCQIGRTTALEIKRRLFFPVSQIIQEVDEKITQTEKIGRKIDYLTLVPDGEPTLDANLGELLEKLKSFSLPVAIISNAALITDREVQNELMLADWVSVKIDSANEPTWRQINRPHGRLSLAAVLEGILEFRRRFNGELVTETMLISDVNDLSSEILSLAAYLLELQPFKSYLSIPTRPPYETWVKAPRIDSLRSVMEILSQRVAFIDVLFDPEDPDFIATGDLRNDILGIIAVHPLREESLRKMVARSNAGWKVVEDLLAAKDMDCLEYWGDTFYVPGSRTG